MKIIINGKDIEAREGDTILQAASNAGIRIPTLCHLKGAAPGGSCGLCEVEADGKAVRACVFKVKEGLEIVTDSEKIYERRRARLLELADKHRFDCEFCERCMDCEFIRVLAMHGIYDFEYQRRSNETDRMELAGNIIFDRSLCIGCGRCTAACKDGSVRMMQTDQGRKAAVSAELYTGSGECVAACPTAAFHIEEKDEIRKIRRAIHDRECYAIVCPYAVAVFGEMLFDDPGTDCAGKMAAILRKIGFRKVFLTGKEFSAAAIAHAVRDSGYNKDGRIVTASVSTITGPERPGADIDITIQTLLTIFRRACVSRTTMVRVWRETEPEGFDVPEGAVPDGPVEYSFGGAMPHRDCFINNMNDLGLLRQSALERILG